VLRGSDDTSLIIEMSIVYPHWVLDFVKSTLDVKPDFSPEVWDHWWEKIREEFGDDWPDAEALYYTFEKRYGIYHLDLSPRNVHFGRSTRPS